MKIFYIIWNISNNFGIHQFKFIDYFQARRDKEVVKNRVKALLGLPQKWKPKADVEVSNLHLLLSFLCNCIFFFPIYEKSRIIKVSQ